MGPLEFWNRLGIADPHGTRAWWRVFEVAGKRGINDGVVRGPATLVP